MTPVVKSWFLLVLFAGSLLFAAEAGAEVRLPRLVGDNMVLQRNAPLQIWGWADAGEPVRLSFRGRSVSVRADGDGRWSVTLPAQRAGGPFDMRIRGNNVLTLHDILVGDVWLASGQSNMQFPMAGDAGFGGVANEAEEIATANFPQIRLFVVDHAMDFRPAENMTASGWTAVTPASIRGFSAVAYLFGRELHQKYRVPIGLIEAAWGGTPAETWISADAAKKFPEFAGALVRESQVDAAALAQYDDYVAKRNRWYQQHGKEDRGSLSGSRWAAGDFDAADWPTTIEPKPWPIKTAKGFDGTLWLRKEIDVPLPDAAKGMRLHLSHLLQADTTYFNGTVVGETRGEIVDRDYPVAADLVKPGLNVVTVRLVGQYQSGDGYVGMLGDAAEMYAQLSSGNLPLAGAWRYQPGPDLSDLPEVPPLAEFRTLYPQAPTLLFNAMIAPLARYRLKGVIWYQGESNVGRAAQYRSLFPALIEDWRAVWGYQLPFLFVQLAGFEADLPDARLCARAELREAQSMALSLAATAMATAIDVGDRDDVHPKNKQTVAHRLALSAMKTVYGEPIVSSGPMYRSMHLDAQRIRVKFFDPGSSLRAMPQNGEIRGFDIAGNDGRFVRAQAVEQGDEVIVWSDAVKRPAAVRYDWSNTPDGDLYNRDGLPAVPFRTSR